MHPGVPLASAANPLIKDIRRAVQKGDATADGLWVAEGLHLLEEARRTGLAVPAVLVSESARNREELCRLAGNSRLMLLPDRVFDGIASTETSQGLISLVRPPEWSPEKLFSSRSLVVVLDGIQDPGNAGAVVRAAEAFGATGILFLRGTTGPTNPKTLRASAGSLFRVPFLLGVEPSRARKLLESRSVLLYGAVPFADGVRRAGDLDFRTPCAFAIGSEGRGLGTEMRAAATGVTIPTAGVESLNAAVSAAILLYEAACQRGTP